MNREAIKNIEQIKPTEYDRETLEPILEYDRVVVEHYPKKKIDAIRKIKLQYDVDLATARDIVETQWEKLSKEENPKRETEFRFTKDNRLIDADNYLAWKIENVLEEKIPASLKKFIRCPIYFTIDERRDELKEEWEKEGLCAGNFFIPYLDIILVSHFNVESDYWKTVLAHEIAHSILHKKAIEEGVDYHTREKEADDFVRDNFGKEEWFCEQALHGGS